MGHRLKSALSVTFAAGIMLWLYLMSRDNYLLFHSTAELVGITVAASVLLAARYSFIKEESGYPEFLGIALSSVSVILFVHLLAYKGMGVFPGSDANLPTQLWVISRYVLAVSLLVAPSFSRKPSPTVLVSGAFAVVTSMALLSVFAWGWFPDAYVEGVGLTGFKVLSEYAVVGILSLAALRTYHERAAIDPRALRLLLAAIGLFAASSLAFTLYTDVYGIFNAVGHFAQVAAFAMVFVAIVQVGITWPVARLYRELQEREEGLRKANHDLMLVSRSKDEFLANMSHELRTPLNSIIGFSEILLRGLPGELNAEQQKQLLMVNQAGHHLLSLVNDILDLARMEAESKVLELADFDLNDELAQVVMMVRPLAMDKGLALAVEAVEGGPVMHSDPRAVQQIVLNLLSNAIKFTDAGAIHVSVKVRTGMAIIAIQDSGCGIAADDISVLFGDFSRTQQAFAKEGTGLGLAVSSRLAALLGGDIDVVSQLGVGSTFTVALPLEAPDSSVIAAKSQAHDLEEYERTGLAVRAGNGAIPISLPLAQSAMLLVNAQTCAIEDASEGAARLYGWSRKRLIRMRLSDLDFLDSETRRRIVRQVMAGQVSQLILNHRMESGASVRVEVLLAPVSEGGRSMLLAIIERLPEQAVPA
ncbi:MAG: hypothetical protein CVT66_03460 [Actinobacteria bacterium HGW-Actinobacteria-6]|jgi:signal transduction histidine kinase|nr:MAG: hypothetical protein CVT66_03460 [Actinobacteria bacterium HGW-Actinobacteria-6]